MKESVYGWYPPARDPWKTYRKPRQDKSYEDRCVYKQYKSMFNGRSREHMPEPPTSVKIQLAPRPLSRSSSRASTTQVHHNVPTPTPTPAQKPAPQPPSPVVSNPPRAEIPDYRYGGIHPHATYKLPSSRSGSRSFRPASSRSQEPSEAFLHVEGQSPSPVRIFSSPVPSHPKRPSSRSSSSKPWAMKLEETAYSLLPQPPEDSKVHTCPVAPSKPDRVQSACVVRPRVSAPQRPIRSADPRHRSTVCVPTSQLEGDELIEEKKQEATEPEKEETEEEEESRQVLGIDEPLDYDEQLEKYGWRMQIPGDPLNLKRPCIAKRKPITVTVPIPAVPPDAPKVHIESNEPYFYNTIPRHPMTFTIHQDWSSEVLLAKRLELQKKDGDMYKYRQNYFSFIY